MTNNKFISQQHRIANFSSNLKKQMEELNKEEYHEEEYQYYSATDGRPLIDWEEYEKTLDKANLIELIIKPNVFNFKDNKLVIKNYPNLKTLYACGCGLESVELDHDGLENLYLVANQLSSIDLSKTPNLVNLTLTRNYLTRIDVNHLKKLEDLRINKNVMMFDYLFQNEDEMINLDVSGCENLVNLDCSACSVKKLILGKHDQLAIIDADANIIKDLNFPSLPNLRMLSLRGNLKGYQFLFQFRYSRRNRRIISKPTLQLRSPKLMFLDYYNAYISEVEHVLGLENPEQLRICNDESYTNPDGTYNPDVPTDWEDLFNKMQEQRDKDWLRGDWAFAFEDSPNKTTKKDNNSDQAYDSVEGAEEQSEPPITDSSLLTSDYPNLNKDNETDELTITHLGLTGTIVFDGWQKLRKLNVGNNYLSYLVVKNCPNLTTLRYAHNKLKHDAFIENCLQLTTIDKENYNGGIVWDEQSEEQFEQGELQGKANLDEQLNNELEDTEQQEEQEELQNEDTPSVENQTPTNHRAWIIGGGIVLVAVIGVVIYFLGKNRREKN